MGKIHIKIKIFGKNKEKTLKLIVDTGSIFTWIKRKTLQELGVCSRGKQKFVTIEGREIVREIGSVEAEYDSLRMPIPVVFAEDTDREVLGVTALEIFGLTVDPKTGTVKKEETLLALLSLTL